MTRLSNGKHTYLLLLLFFFLYFCRKKKRTKIWNKTEKRDILSFAIWPWFSLFHFVFNFLTSGQAFELNKILPLFKDQKTLARLIFVSITFFVFSVFKTKLFFFGISRRKNSKPFLKNNSRIKTRRKRLSFIFFLYIFFVLRFFQNKIME